MGGTLLCGDLHGEGGRKEKGEAYGLSEGDERRRQRPTVSVKEPGRCDSGRATESIPYRTMPLPPAPPLCVSVGGGGARSGLSPTWTVAVDFISDV